jgi:hypothetical protein
MRTNAPDRKTERRPARSLRARRGWLARIGGAIALLSFVAGLRTTVPAAVAAPGPPARPPREGDANVLVELFTSEGCASCPPADDALRELSRAQPVAGAKVVALSQHVDYWNELGWPDPFSSAEATARQRAYMHLGGRLYTPQAIVDGSAQLIGSREGALEKAIAAAAKRPHARVELAVTTPARGAVEVAVKVSAMPEGAVEPELLVAIAQDRAAIAVGRGENAGRTLEHAAIARSIKDVGAVPPAGVTARTEVQLPVAIGATGAATFTLVAFVQERTSRRVLGSAASSLRAPSGR